MGKILSMDLRSRVIGAVEGGKLHCYPSLGRFGLESLAFLGSGGLVSPAVIASIIGGIFPIAL